MVEPPTEEDRKVILEGSKIDAIQVFRRYLDLGLIGCKRAIEAIREGRLTLDEALGTKAKLPCPHCHGTGYVD